ncbi:extracellular solute-binding protein [Paenibacillus sacheonensis]|uniref:Extracellular solute-binding protein n=1 Tax=Paenibacillus sacheonensis TaxID=742054 RepID=A0A7X5BVY9_9BACL|nr:extracellular solute-binding protein [Paenibacillus sacheonensis]MBM7565812.1 putative aldouronate transport system substrate-binding protein [Paenibacillus sacheonensis]NBC68868.1 extracellular solute-binding protein [Paenibacillus sacheonensis]
MSKNAKSLGLIAAAAIFVLSAAGCSNSNSNANSTAPANTADGTTTGTTNDDAKGANGSSDASNAEPLSFSVTLPANGVDNSASMIQKEWLKLMETKMGRKIDIKWNYIPSSDYDQKVKLMIASNDMTDFFMTPLFYDTSDMAKNGQIIDLMKYKDDMPNYMNYLGQVKNGMTNVTNANGQMFTFKETSFPRFEKDKGMLIQNVSAYRYDLFQKNNIKIPTTLDEVYDAAKQLKQLYPKEYPINTRWNDLRSLFQANHVVNDIYWDGSKFVYGIFEPGYEEALQFANKLYADKLLDPEYLTDTDDTLKQKALNDKNFIWLAQWFTDPANYTREANNGKTYAVSLYPDNPKYGKSWQNVANGNTPDLGWGQYSISSKAKNPEDIVKFVDLQYDPEVIRLLTWGIEGQTYTMVDGQPSFTDEFKKAADPWVVGDKYGIRASKHYSPGLEISSDSKAFVDFAAMDYTYFDGKYEETPIEKSAYLRSLPMPDNDFVPSNYTAPAIQFTPDESQQISEVMTPVKTYIQTEESKFVTGKESFADWSKFIDKVKGMGDIDKVLKIYNDAAERALH